MSGHAAETPAHGTGSWNIKVSVFAHDLKISVGDFSHHS
jgi:hypothetical protein